MSEFNPEYVKQNLPSQIEAIEEVYGNKIFNAVDTIEEVAKQSGAPQFIKDAAAFRTAIETTSEYVKKICGNEGDSATESGSLWGVVTAAKKMAIATGGA